MRVTPPRVGRDAGATLIELLVGIVILAVIAVPLGNLVISVIRNADATSDRVALSHDAQISAAYFARDVAALGVRDYTSTPGVDGNLPYKQSIQVTAAHNQGGLVCGTATTPTALIRFLSDEWDSSTATPTVRTAVVAYYLQPVDGSYELHRRRCAGGSEKDTLLAHHVDPATVDLRCDAAVCTAAAVPLRVTLAFKVSLPSIGAYDIVLDGKRRQT